MTKSISRERFDLFILGTRTFGQKQYREISFWSNSDETVIGFVAQDLSDSLYLYALFQRDLIGRFRFIDASWNYKKFDVARKSLKKEVKKLSESLTSETKKVAQGDEPKEYIQLFKLAPKTKPEALHTHFKTLVSDSAYEPAKKVLEELSPCLQPTDRHLVKEFQTQGFDQRIWEIYLWAALKSLYFTVEQLEAPDFLCGWGNKSLFTIEATTVGPTTIGPMATPPPEPHDFDSAVKYSDEYMTIKYASSLTSKLNKTPPYWSRPNVEGLPFIIAIADFHQPYTSKMVINTIPALAQYLYGFNALVEKLDNGKYQVKSNKINNHSYLEKTIPSGFFSLPNSENVSAVLFSNAGTLNKFNRMGVLAGFGLSNYKYYRVGERYDYSDPFKTDGIKRAEDIQKFGYEESWSEELHLYHNPNARYPLDPNIFKSINQHFSKGDHIYTEGYETWIYSINNIVQLLVP